MKFKSDVQLEALNNATTDTDKFLVSDSSTVKYRTGAQLLSDLGIAGTYVPYTGATGNVNLGTHTLSSYNLIVNHTSGSGVAASITKGGSGEALTINKTSGSGNAMSVTGGNVGIGTINTSTLLQIGNQNSSSDLVSLGVTYNTSRDTRGGITWRDVTNVTGRIHTEYDGTMISMVFGSLYNSGYNSDPLMTIRGNGNVGIGTTNPSEKLDVFGDIIMTDDITYQANLKSLAGTIVSSNVISGDFGFANDAIVSNPFMATTIFNTLGSESMRIDYSGNVGIGTTSPGYKLDVAGDINVGTLTGFDTNRINFNYGYSYIETGVFSSSSYMSINSGMAQVFLSSSGNVGIGTTTPSHKLHVSGTAGIRNSMTSQPVYGYANVEAGDFVVGGNSIYPGVITLYNQDTTISAGQDLGVIQFVGKDDASTGYTSSMIKGLTQNDAGSGSSGGGILSFLTSPGYGDPSEKMRIDSAGNVGIGTSFPNEKLQVNGNGAFYGNVTLYGDVSGYISLNSPIGSMISLDSITYDFSIASGSIVINPLVGTTTFYTYGFERMIIDSVGNVGIGTSTPSYKLDVTGDINFTGTLYQNGTPFSGGGGGGSSSLTSFQYGGFLHTSSSSSTTVYWIPTNYISEVTSGQYYNNWVAPYSGRVKKIVMRWVNGQTPTATSVTFRKAINGSTYGNTYPAAVTSPATTSMIAERDFSSTDITFNAGDRVQLGFTTDGSTRLLQGFAYTVVLEYN